MRLKAICPSTLTATSWPSFANSQAQSLRSAGPALSLLHVRLAFRTSKLQSRLGFASDGISNRL